MEKFIIGAVERCHLPQLGIQNLEIRVDTGAKTSSLHVDDIHPFLNGEEDWVGFAIHPDVYDVNVVVQCQSKVFDTRLIKSSNGASQKRYVIQTLLNLGGQEWPIEITLTDRSEMSYRMLFGREGMANRVLVDPSKTFILSD